jgi:hypothetical protein
MSARMTARRAQAIIDAATLVKAPDWTESRRWHVTANGQVLVIIEPSYSGITRNGWTWWLADIGRMRATPEPTREKAAVAGLAAWQRQATT